MQTNTATILINVIWLGLCRASGVGWTYHGDTGPSHWTDDCTKTSQSPINIILDDTESSDDLVALDLSEYSKINSKTLSIKNNGHTVQLTLPDNTVRIRGGGLPVDYIAAQFHFHWGATDAEGSEHQVNGIKYPLEMHIVHYSSAETNAELAMKAQKGLAVVGVFFKVGQNENAHLKKIIDHFNLATHKDKTNDTSATVDVANLIPADPDEYYRYDGSLTTPPCHESVIWTVMKNPIEISTAQLTSFRNLMETAEGGTDTNLRNNYRPVQNMNSRKVKRSKAISSAGLPKISATLAVFSLLLTALISRV